MKRLQLPQNKLARLAINVGFIPVWLICTVKIWMWIDFWSQFNFPLLSDLWHLRTPTIANLQPAVSALLLVFVPIGFFTRYIWWGLPKSLTNILSNKRIWGRLKPKPRITRSKED